MFKSLTNQQQVYEAIVDRLCCVLFVLPVFPSLFCLGCSLEELLSLTGQVSGKNIIRTNLMLGRNDLKKQCTTT